MDVQCTLVRVVVKGLSQCCNVYRSGLCNDNTNDTFVYFQSGTRVICDYVSFSMGKEAQLIGAGGPRHVWCAPLFAVGLEIPGRATFQGPTSGAVQQLEQ